MDGILQLLASRLPPPGKTPGGAWGLPSLTGAADAFTALALAAGGPAPRLVLAVTAGIPESERLADDLRLLATPDFGPAAATTRILELPARIPDDRSSLARRLRTAAALNAYALAPYPAVIVAPAVALTQSLPAGEAAPLVLKPGESAPTFATLTAELARRGYRRTALVEREGDYSVRGGIVDAWCPGEEFPTRAEFFGDDLESLRAFESATQRSVASLQEATFLDADETAADTTATGPLKLLPPTAALLLLEHNDAPALPPDGERFLRLYTGEPAPAHVPEWPFATAPLPGFAELGADSAHHPELFDAARERLSRHLAALEAAGGRILKLDALSRGFEIVGELAVVAKSDRAFTRRRHLPRVERGGGQRLADFEELEPGEYVVHLNYGVGKFVGSSLAATPAGHTEVYTIEYADGALLNVPVTQAHLLSRYVGVKGEAVRLHRLDGKRWKKDREAAQRAVSDLAAALLETQARREALPGFACEVAHCEGLEAFEAAFPYEETPDQLAAIAAVKRDLASPRPMDRLICGDAGYGKTEVAMRAAYIMALNGKQTAVLAPTTVLTEQHFESFTARFEGTPVRIEAMSRFQGPETRRGTRERLASGACDIVIGTHALLGSQTRFHDLGLVIIDEEQRFGVRHKEHLKRLRETADVLTMSATPIPRTLYLSMTGARELSLLRTPPRERVAVETRIVSDSDAVIGAAIDAELARGGQVFFLHNRVTTLPRVAERLRKLRPQLKVVTAHGQMDAVTLSRRMREFERGDYELLLSTSIVESGIDIPRANTILVDHAEQFGLADLYQLRGRVGRSAREGHAIFLLPAAGLVDSDARERLKALKRHGELGGGFDLAVRDLELRGAGNLLGAQQSGHIAAIGFTLYCQLLKRTIALFKGERPEEPVDVHLNLDFLDLSPTEADAANAASLPYAYVEEDHLRMGLLKRLATLTRTGELKALKEELADRFGPLPAAARRLLNLAELRLECARAGVTSIDANAGRAVLYRNREIIRVETLTGKSADRRLAELKTAVRAVLAK